MHIIAPLIEPNLYHLKARIHKNNQHVIPVQVEHTDICEQMQGAKGLSTDT